MMDFPATMPNRPDPDLMLRRGRAPCAVWLALAITLLCDASAAGKKGQSAVEIRALATAGKAISKDYKKKDYTAARKRLQRAIVDCKEADCSAPVRARLYCSLGVVFAGGLGDNERGLLAFRSALQLEPDIEPEPAVFKGKVKKLFEQAREETEQEAATVESEPDAEKDAEEPADEAPVKVYHESVEEAQAGYTVPIYAELPEESAGVELELRYRKAGKERWQSVSLEPVSGGFGAEIPCKAAKQEGTLEYYLHASFRDQEGPVSGSESEPHTLSLVSETSIAAPNFPGPTAPTACDSDEGKTPAAGAHVEAELDEDISEPAAKSSKLLWLQAMVAQDISIVGGDDVCTFDGQNRSFYCLRDDGFQYIGMPVFGVEDRIATQPRLATTRLLAGARLPLGPVSLGAILGFALRGGWRPTGGSAFLPLHAEARGAYWFTGNAFANQFGLYALAAFGMAQVDTTSETWLEEDRTWPAPADQPDANDVQYRQVEVLHRAGRMFGGVGAGAFLPLSSSFGLVAEVRGSYFFPAAALVVTPSLGATYGL
jgi:hypothetical protein